jgi:hypothetical protein
MRALARRLLALYPLAYRGRYGEEMEALIDDSELRLSTLLDLARGAAAAHLRPPPGLTDALPPGDRFRAGAVGLLACWLLFALAGLGFYRTTEEGGFHHAGEVHLVLGYAHLAVQLLAIVGSLAVAAALVPFALLALRRARDDRRARTAAFLAVASVAALVLATAGLVAFAHFSAPVSGPAGVAVLTAWGIVAIAAGTGCVLAARRGLFAISIGRGGLRVLLALGPVTAAAMVAILLATAVYLMALLVDAPELASAANGPGGLISIDVSIILQLAVMGAAAIGACVCSARGFATQAFSRRSSSRHRR